MGKTFRSKINDEAVSSATGKTWKEWFNILKKAGALKMNHKDIVAVLNDKFGISPWWRQMIAVTFEQENELRKKHEKPDGFQISKSKTLPLPLNILYKFCSEPDLQKKWLNTKGIKITKTTKNKSVRMMWNDGLTRVEFQFYEKDKNKSQITVQHNKLKASSEAEKMKLYWAEKLEALKQTALS